MALLSAKRLVAVVKLPSIEQGITTGHAGGFAVLVLKFPSIEQRSATDGVPCHCHVSLFRLLALILGGWFAPKLRFLARTGVQGVAAGASIVARLVNQILQVAGRQFDSQG
jgi:hypothetical protein